MVAVGLISNIFQFIDVGSRFVSKVWNISMSGRQGLTAVLDVQKVTEDLEHVLPGFKSPNDASPCLDSSDRGLQQLAGHCERLALELIESIRKIDLPEKSRKRDNLMSAIRLIWKEEELKSLQSRLDGYRQELILHLLALIRYVRCASPATVLKLTFDDSRQSQQSLQCQQQILEKISEIQAGNKRKEQNNSQVALGEHGIGTAILSIVTPRADSMEQSHEKESLQKELITAIYQDNEAKNVANLSIPSVPEDRQGRLWDVFLLRLRYDGMEDREGRIAQAHKETFRWIFEDRNTQEKSWSNFKDWLESDSQLYWITGKAGSGKSTLMKYICQPESDVLESNTGVTHESRYSAHLQKWAGGSQLITAVHFFWNSGTKLQMSHRGLLLSLLYQLLRQAPHLIATISPRRWEALCLFNDNPKGWSDQELHTMLRTAVREASRSLKICLFVDGLDEFDGELNDLICLFQDLVQNRNVKACVASRPWLVFEDAFKHKPSLMLQDLTFDDIKLYVMSSLRDNSSFAQLQRRETEYADQLVEDIVLKASGVFLWVHLVVASLLAGMGFGDRVSDLQKRLELLPPELEMLYDKILQSLDSFYLEHAAQLFKLVQESYDPPPLILLSFADEEDLDPYAYNIKPLSHDELSLRADTMRRRLNSRCKGFLEVGNKSTGAIGEVMEQTVQYLHRTVKDYMESKEAQRTLETAIRSDFDPHQRLCVGGLAHLKVIEEYQDFRAHSSFWLRIHRYLYSAARIHDTNRTSIVPLLDELDETGRTLAKRLASEVTAWLPLERDNMEDLLPLLEAGLWVPSQHFHKYASKPEESLFGACFLSLVVRYGITDYIEAKANRGCLVQHFRTGIWPLLLDAVSAGSDSMIGFSDAVPRPDMINCLLKKGANPNYDISRIRGTPAHQASVWLQTVQYILQRNEGPELKSPWLEIAEAMIRHGAKAHVDEERARLRVEANPHQSTLLDQLKVTKKQHPQSRFLSISGPSRQREILPPVFLLLG